MVMQRRASLSPSMMAGGAKVKVGIVGATGAVGEEIVKVRLVDDWSLARSMIDRAVGCVDVHMHACNRPIPFRPSIHCDMRPPFVVVV